MYELPLWEFLDKFKGVVEIKSLKDIKSVIPQLEDFHLFESAENLQVWHAYLSDCIQAEFDESCLFQPIYEYFPKEEHEELGDGWLHEWELPPEWGDPAAAA